MGDGEKERMEGMGDKAGGRMDVIKRLLPSPKQEEDMCARMIQVSIR